MTELILSAVLTSVFVFLKKFVAPLDWNCFLPHKLVMFISVLVFLVEHYVHVTRNVLGFAVLCCMGLINKTNSNRKKKSCVFLTQIYGNMSAMRIMHLLLSNSVADLPANVWAVLLICHGTKEVFASENSLLSLVVCEIINCLGLPAQLYCICTALNMLVMASLPCWCTCGFWCGSVGPCSRAVSVWNLTLQWCTF